MSLLTVRPMHEAEFGPYRERLIAGYAERRAVADGTTLEVATARASEQTDQSLPDGLATAGAVLLVAEDGAGQTVGWAWIGLVAPNRSGAWLYDIEVAAGRRGEGYGRALLAAVEQEVVRHGVATLGLNVFGANTVARGLYESAGYEPTAIQMVKTL